MTKLSDALKKEIDAFADRDRAHHAYTFFKAVPGGYGEGDHFLGVRMPQIRSVCERYRNVTIQDLHELLLSQYHEHRIASVVIMADVYAQSTSEFQQDLYTEYIWGVKNDRINNWDLIDISAPYVVGAYVISHAPDPLYTLANSNHLWSKRTAIISTFAYLRRGDASHTIAIAKILLHDQHDLIQKAVGWLLREAGNRVDRKILIEFLDTHAHEMPRTMLRYSLEKLPSNRKAYYMQAARRYTDSGSAGNG